MTQKSEDINLKAFVIKLTIKLNISTCPFATNKAQITMLLNEQQKLNNNMSFNS